MHRIENSTAERKREAKFNCTILLYLMHFLFRMVENKEKLRCQCSSPCFRI